MSKKFLACKLKVRSTLKKIITSYADDKAIVLPECFDIEGFAYPISDNFVHGASRLGKLCPNDPFSGPPASNRAKALDIEISSLFALMITGGVQATDDPNCICKQCDLEVFAYPAPQLKGIAGLDTDEFIIEPTTELIHSGSLSDMFGFKKNNKPISIMISMSGSGSSVMFLALILIFMVKCEGITSTAKRCQMAVIVGKLLFFLAILGGTALRQIMVACKFFSVLFHYSLFVALASKIWLSLKVAHLLWTMNHNFASLSIENQKKDDGKGEIATFIGIWIGILCIVISCWLYDSFIDSSIIGYGLHEICLITGQRGKMYLLVIPTAGIVLLNIGIGMFSLHQYNNLVKEKAKTGKQFLKFLGRLTAFQSTQWIFGILYYFTGNQYFKYNFEICVAFEGSFLMFSSYLSRMFVFFKKQNRVITDMP